MGNKKKRDILVRISLFFVLSFISGAGWLLIPSQAQFTSPWLSMGYRFFFSGIVLLIVELMRGGRFIDKNVISKLFFQGIVFFPVNYYFSYLACSYINPGFVSLINALGILPAMMLQVVFGSLHFKKNLIFPVLVAILGVFLVFHDDVSSSGQDRIGIIFAVLSILAATLGLFLIPKITQKTQLSVFVITGYSMIIGGIFSLIIGTALLGNLDFPLQPVYLRDLGILCIVTPVFFVAHYYFSMRYGSIDAAMVFMFAPVFSLAASKIFANYHVSLLDVTGCVMIVSSGALISRFLVREVP